MSDGRYIHLEGLDSSLPGKALASRLHKHLCVVRGGTFEERRRKVIAQHLSLIESEAVGRIFCSLTGWGRVNCLGST